MQKALLISILGATILIPFFAFRGGTVKSAVRRSAIATVTFCVLYWLGLMFVYPMLAPAKKPQQQAPTQ
ncbi:MAG: hypothetical protein JWP97_459 [Labilithrix sp.]|nr:hypothetical protein [Labilithrix sp.]